MMKVFLMKWLFVLLCTFFVHAGKKSVLEEINSSNSRVPIIPEGLIFFWRPQKVGSSTILSLLISYSFRYNIINRRRGTSNGFCIKIANCLLSGQVADAKLSSNQMAVLQQRYPPKIIANLDTAREQKVEMSKYQMVTSHHVCNMEPSLIKIGMKCAFESGNQQNQRLFASWNASRELKEVFAVRDPLSRVISSYYFWGELYKLKQAKGGGGGKGTRPAPHRALAAKHRLGQTGDGEEVQGRLFKYHGNESSVPPEDIAQSFAEGLPLTPGMPGPSLTWSLFSDSLASALAEMSSDRLMTIVTERLDESLVAASHHLQWSLADVVFTVPRKALSSHPKHSQWPQKQVATMRAKLEDLGEYEVYRKANERLDERISSLTNQGIDFKAELTMFQTLRDRVTQLCLSEEYLSRYRQFITDLGFKSHRGDNKLRDAADVYTDEGHSFSVNGDILFSYDVCGSCEAHAILEAMRSGLGGSVAEAPLLKDLPQHITKNNVHFANCPH